MPHNNGHQLLGTNLVDSIGNHEVVRGAIRFVKRAVREAQLQVSFNFPEVYDTARDIKNRITDSWEENRKNPDPVVKAINDFGNTPVGRLVEAAVDPAGAAATVVQELGAGRLDPRLLALVGMIDLDRGVLRFKNVDNVSTGVYARGRGRFGRQADGQGRKVELAVAEKNVEQLEGLKNRDVTAYNATNYNVSPQGGDIGYQAEYGRAHDVSAESHHMSDHKFFGDASAGPDKPEVDKEFHKLGGIKGNDALNMVYAWGIKKSKDILAVDHNRIHNRLYPRLPERQFIQAKIDDGSWYKLKPKTRATLLKKASDEHVDIVMRWAKWKLALANADPTFRVLTPKMKRKYIEQQPKWFAELGKDQFPTYEELMAQPKGFNNDELRHVFGLSLGQKPSKLRRDVPLSVYTARN